MIHLYLVLEVEENVILILGSNVFYRKELN